MRQGSLTVNMHLTFDRTLLVAACFVLISGFLSTAPAQQSAKLARIEFVGLKRLRPDQLIPLTGLQIGQTVNGEIFDAAANKLLQTGLFRRLAYRVHSNKDQATIIFDVEESAAQLPVVFENFVWFTTDEITEAIKRDVPFFNGTAPANGEIADKIAATLQRLLASKNIKATVEYLPYVSKDKQELVYTVKGTRIPICSLHFPGAAAVSEADLVRASRELFNSDYSQKDVATFAPIKLLPLYRRLGRLRAEFQTPTVALENSPQCSGGVSVTVPVDEGLTYHWAKSVWDGNDKLTIEDLATALGMNPGDLADGIKIDNGLKNVAKAYGNRGYLNVTINESIEYDDNASTVTYRFDIKEGPRFFMGNLIVNGLPAADADQLKAKWTLGQNAVFDGDYLEQFRNRELRDFLTSMRRSRAGPPVEVQVETRPDRQKQTVDVLITFK